MWNNIKCTAHDLCHVSINTRVSKIDIFCGITVSQRLADRKKNTNRERKSKTDPR